jgi:HPt (histidine-containing phosphotransfer) domain-containing protein
MPAHPIIDPRAIQNLRDLAPSDNDAFLREVVGMFLSDTPERIAELEESVRSADGVRFTRAAHSIKGSSSNLGADALREAAERAENDSDTRPVAQLEPLVTEIRAEFARVREELERILAAGPAGR